MATLAQPAGYHSEDWSPVVWHAAKLRAQLATGDLASHTCSICEVKGDIQSKPVGHRAQLYEAMCRMPIAGTWGWTERSAAGPDGAARQEPCDTAFSRQVLFPVYEKRRKGTEPPVLLRRSRLTDHRTYQCDRRETCGVMTKTCAKLPSVAADPLAGTRGQAERNNVARPDRHANGRGSGCQAGAGRASTAEHKRRSIAHAVSLVRGWPCQ